MFFFSLLVCLHCWLLVLFVYLLYSIRFVLYECSADAPSILFWFWVDFAFRFVFTLFGFDCCLLFVFIWLVSGIVCVLFVFSSLIVLTFQGGCLFI